MSRNICYLAGLMIAGLALTPADAATHQVLIQNNFFNPKTLTIQEGDTVTWVQRGQNHDTVSEDGLWSSGILSANKTFSFTFDTAGAYKYFCTPHRNQGMTGTITVQAAANTPPTISLTSPVAGATFNAADTIVFAANATDNGQVVSVEFFANDISVGSSTLSPFGIVTTLAPGNYSITAKATDNLGASATSAPVNVTVQDLPQNQLPTVTISSDQTLYAEGSTVTLKAVAADADGSIAQVEFFNGATSAGVDTSAPYELPLQNLVAGVHSFTAAATDNAGGKTTSSALEIRVAAPPKINSITRDESGTKLNVTGTIGILHTLEGTVDMSNWTTVGTITPTDGPVSVSDNSNGKSRFYRMLVK